MTTESAFETCEAIVRRADPDRYFSALFAPAPTRPLLFALYAFNHELAHIGEAVREPMPAAIRLEWWREAAESARDGRPRAHDTVRGLARLFAGPAPPFGLFEAMIEARRRDADPDAFADLPALEAYADATCGNLMRIAAHLLGVSRADDALMHHAGIAYALTGLMRSLPLYESRGRSRLPSALVRIRGRQGAIADVVEAALTHYDATRRAPKIAAGLAAILPAALVPLYAKVLKHDAASGRMTDIALYRRQWTMLRAAMRGQV